ncbi:type I secretion C-terminal target domain-containing protein, partial [Comamonas sp. Z3]|uniref:beta strand repeat-containing protein n=1 Tax=Comamonas sp. Z3 TaxID=2601247 RepID=UPI0011E6F0DB
TAGDDSVKDSFTVTVTDAANQSKSDNLVVLITDTAPEAKPDTGNVSEGSTLTVAAAAGVLANDKAGADGWNAGGAVVGVSNSSSVQGTANATGFTIVGQYGTLSLNKDGSYSYTSNPNAVTKGEADVFTYTVKDGDGDLSTATLTINVADVTGTPVTTTGGSVTEAGLAGGTSAGQGNVYSGSLSLQSGWTAQAASGTTANGTYTVKADGTYTFTLTSATTDVAGQAETNSFTYTAKDANGNTVTNTVTVTIVDDTPVAASINAGSLTEDAAQTSLSGTVAPAAGNSNSFGGDGAATTGATGWGSVSAKLGATTVNLGDYGKLTQNSDGTWKFELDNSKPATQALTTGQSIIVTMGYTLTDKDGDQRSNNVTFQINGVNDAFPDKNTTTEDHAVSGNVLLNDEGYVSGGALAITSFSVNGSTYSVGASAVNVMDAGKVVGTISLAANGGYVFTPSSDWSGKVPTVTYTTNTGVTSTLDIDVTPVADTPLVTVNVGAGSTPVTTSITATSVNSSNAGHTVTAYNINGSKGAVSVVTGTDHDGFGVVGAASGDSTEIGRSSSGSESLAIQFNVPVTAITVQFAWLASGEWARYQMFDEAKKPVVLGYNADGTVNAASGLYGFVKGGTDKVDTQFKLSVPAGNTISQIVFDAPRVDDDYLINKVTYTTATTYPLTITATPQDVDYSEAVTKVTVEVPKGVTLSAGTQIDATHWSLPLVSNGSYSVSIDPITKAVTITGLNMTVPENVQVNEIKVVAVVADGSSTADGSASFTSKPDAVDDTNSATLTSKSVATAPSITALATFTSGEANAWKLDNSSSTRVYKSNSELSSTDTLNSDKGKWLVSSVNGTTWDGSSTGGGLVLTDNNGRASGDAKAVTPTYTPTVAGTTLQFKVTSFSNASSSSDSVNWTLYKSTDGGVTWSAVSGQANSGVITGTGTYTTTALEADATYRILLTVHEGNSNSMDAAVTFDDFTANVPNPDTIVWSSTAVAGSVTSNDTLGTLGETSTLSVFNGSTWVNAASGGTTINGSYGTLLIKADGSYTYTPTASAAGAGKVEHFDYKLTQADGDTDTASLDISIDATGPGATTLAASRMASDTGSHEVHSTSSGDSLLGTAEDDLFIWHQGDAGTVSRPVTDVVKNFGASGNDALDLGDLLQGEEASSDLSKFLHLETRTEADGKTIDTVIKVSTAGALDANGNGFNQKILVEGVDLVGASHDQNALIKELIDQGKLKIDHS